MLTHGLPNHQMLQLPLTHAIMERKSVAEQVARKRAGESATSSPTSEDSDTAGTAASNPHKRRRHNSGGSSSTGV
jgi:hypothetical protein